MDDLSIPGREVSKEVIQLLVDCFNEKAGEFAEEHATVVLGVDTGDLANTGLLQELLLDVLDNMDLNVQAANNPEVPPRAVIIPVLSKNVWSLVKVAMPDRCVYTINPTSDEVTESPVLEDTMNVLNGYYYKSNEDDEIIWRVKVIKVPQVQNLHDSAIFMMLNIQCSLNGDFSGKAEADLYEYNANWYMVVQYARDWLNDLAKQFLKKKRWITQGIRLDATPSQSEASDYRKVEEFIESEDAVVLKEEDFSTPVDLSNEQDHEEEEEDVAFWVDHAMVLQDFDSTVLSSIESQQ